ALRFLSTEEDAFILSRNLVAEKYGPFGTAASSGPIYTKSPFLYCPSAPMGKRLGDDILIQVAHALNGGPVARHVMDTSEILRLVTCAAVLVSAAPILSSEKSVISSIQIGQAALEWYSGRLRPYEGRVSLLNP